MFQISFYSVFLLVLFVNSYSCAKLYPGDHTVKNATMSISRSSETTIKTYLVYIIGVTMGLMTLLIISLIYILCRDKCGKYKRFSFPSIGKVMNQDKIDGNILHKTNSYNRNESTMTLSSTVDPFASMQPLTPTRIEKEQKCPVIFNKKLHNESIILPEEINKICQRALSKPTDETASLDNINEILSGANNEPVEYINFNMPVRKSASTPDLDIYDVLPSTRTPDDMYTSVCDDPPRNKKLIITDSEGRYLMPISKNYSETEPSYINAYTNKHK